MNIQTRVDKRIYHRISAAIASDASGIGRIDLLIDQKLVATCTGTTNCGYGWSMNRAASGVHTITATATDKAQPSNTASASI